MYSCTSTSEISTGRGLLGTDLAGGVVLLAGEAGAQACFRVYVQGGEGLVLAGWSLEGRDAALFALRETQRPPLRLAPGKDVGVRLCVLWRGPARESDAAQLVLEAPEAANVDASGKLRVPIRGVVPAALAALECGQPLEFGSVGVGQQRHKTCRLQNKGKRTFRLEDARYHRMTGGEEAFRWVSPGFPIEIPPGGEVAVTLAYTPQSCASLEHKGRFALRTDLPEQHTLSLRVNGLPHTTEVQTETFRQLSQPKADILLVLDTSASMQDLQDSLAKNLKNLLRWLATLGLDLQLGFITTDVSGKQYPAGCLRSFLASRDFSREGMEAFLARTRAVTQSGEHAQIIEAAALALHGKVLEDPQCNKGFVRKDASLSLIIISNNPDRSPRPLSSYVSFFRDYKGFRHPDMVRVSGVGAYARSSPACQEGKCRLLELTRQMRGIYGKIGQDTMWAQTLTQLGAITLGYRREFFLSMPPVPGSIQVVVNGAPVKSSPQDGWSYDAISNTLSFAYAVLPPPDALIEVSYHQACF